MDLSTFELVNISPDQQVRWGFESLHTPRDGYSFHTGWTIESFHYIFEREDTTGELILDVYDSIGLVLVTSQTIASVGEDQVLTYGVVNREMLVTGPNFNPLWGYVGGGVSLASKVDSIFSATTAIDLPIGICCSFGNRIALAQGSILYFSDPETTRTFVGQNAVSLPGHIYNLVETTQGLLISTSQGTFLLPKDALSQGQEVFGFLAQVSSFTPQEYQTLVNSPIGPVGLNHSRATTSGIFTIAEPPQPIPLKPFRGRRVLTPRLELVDWAEGRLFWHPQGVAVGLDEYTLMVGQKGPYWIEAAGETLRGMLIDTDQSPLYLFGNHLARMTPGVETDFGADNVTGLAAAVVPIGTDAVLLKGAVTQANNDGYDQSISVNGQTYTLTNDSGDVLVFDTAVDGDIFQEADLQTARHRMRVRTTDVQVEISVEGAGSSIGPVDLQLAPAFNAKRGQNR